MLNISKLPRQARRQGFTLVEVALAVAVGLIIIGGAVLGYNAVKDNAANSNARDRVLTAVSMVEEYSSANAGHYPVTGQATFINMWKHKRPDDYASSPWGGAAAGANGADEALAVGTSGNAVQSAAPTAVNIPGIGTYNTAVPSSAADMIYISMATSAPWINLNAYSTQSVVAVKNYAVGIYDKNGMPWWDVKGGK